MSSLQFSKWFFILISSLLYMPAAQAANNLENHPSPYIRMHAHDAVDWQIWNQSVLDRAKKENKLIFISVGYYSCHWCHVMRNESFTNKDIANIINRRFIPVKIDRELNPALDNYLIDFVQKTRGHAGWPLNVFVTPAGHPLVGLVYLPADEFVGFMGKLSTAWHEDSDYLKGMALQAFNHSQQLNQQQSQMLNIDQQLSAYLEIVRKNADQLEGGIGKQSKFPRPAMLMTLMQLYQQHPKPWLEEFLLLTLNQMASHGLHDVIGGGFYRYATDPGWQVPHFEKMLYTNAGLILVYLKAYELFGDDLYLDIAIETTEFLLRDMRAENAGFISALSAQDAQGIEGGNYVWDQKQLQQQLTPAQWQQLKQHWRLVELEHVSGIFPVGLALGEDWRDINKQLLSKRQDNPPLQDDKLLPSWNGYVLSALAEMVLLTGRQDFVKAGHALFEFLQQQVGQGLKRTVATSDHRYLEDYAYVAQGMLDWQGVMGKQKYGMAAKSLAVQALELFSTDQGWKLSDTSLLPMPSDLANVADAELPSSAVVVLKLIRQAGLERETAPLKQRLTHLEENIQQIKPVSLLQYSSQIGYLQQLQKIVK
ncbi:MAG: DUF255 domain-containing protein [Gammaproteobacteria bacterium]|nr:DUF255 domain-containing protein [Gammaproteobacteria bacterium]